MRIEIVNDQFARHYISFEKWLSSNLASGWVSIEFSVWFRFKAFVSLSSSSSCFSFFFFALFLINNNNLSGKQLCCYFCSPVHFVNCPLVRTLNFTFCIWLPATILSFRIHSTGFVYSLHIFIIYSVQSSVDDYWSNGSN